MTKSGKAQCDLWKGARNVPDLVRAMGDEEGVVTGVSISAYLGSGKVVVDDDPVVAAAFGPGFRARFTKHLDAQNAS